VVKGRKEGLKPGKSLAPSKERRDDNRASIRTSLIEEEETNKKRYERITGQPDRLRKNLEKRREGRRKISPCTFSKEKFTSRGKTVTGGTQRDRGD